MLYERLLKLVISSFGGVLGGLALGGDGFWWLMPLSIAFLWSAVKTPFNNFFWGFFIVLISHRWLLDLHPMDWVGIPKTISLTLAIFILFFCSLFSGGLTFLWSFCVNNLSNSFRQSKYNQINISCVIFSSCFWGLCEVYLSQLPLFWIGIGESLVPRHIYIVGLARWFGSGGIAALQLIFGWWLWRVLIAYRNRNKWIKVFSIGCSFLIILNAIGWGLLVKDYQNTSYSSVAILQPNIPIREKFRPYTIHKLSELIDASLFKSKELGADILIAPEGALPLEPRLEFQSPLLFFSGGFRSVEGSQRSSLLVFQPGSRDYSLAIDKHRLVPLGEWIPGWLSKYSKGLSAVGGVVPGTHSRLLSAPNYHPVAVAICYELANGKAISKAVLGGAKSILTIANLDPYPELLQRQFISIAKLRSIENAREVVAASNTGPSALVDKSGGISFSAKSFEEQLSIVQVKHYEAITIYTKFGEIPLFVIMTLCIVNYIKLRNKLH